MANDNTLMPPPPPPPAPEASDTAHFETPHAPTPPPSESSPFDKPELKPIDLATPEQDQPSAEVLAQAKALFGVYCAFVCLVAQI